MGALDLTNEETSFGISDNPISAYTYYFMKFKKLFI